MKKNHSMYGLKKKKSLGPPKIKTERIEQKKKKKRDINDALAESLLPAQSFSHANHNNKII